MACVQSASRYAVMSRHVMLSQPIHTPRSQMGINDWWTKIIKVRKNMDNMETQQGDDGQPVNRGEFWEEVTMYRMVWNESVVCIDMGFSYNGGFKMAAIIMSLAKWAAEEGASSVRV